MRDQGQRAETLHSRLSAARSKRDRAAYDFGNIVHALPRGVGSPRDVHEVASLLAWCNAHRVKVVVRGAGHSTEGQTQTHGVVLDLRQIRGIDSHGDTVTLGAGARWLEVVAALARTSKRIPVLPDFLGLSVGGTLSVGGVGKDSHRHGMQVDNVVALTVVTPTGEIVECSRRIRADLFSAVLGGVGAFGVIAHATMRLVSKSTYMHVQRSLCDDFATFLRELGSASRSKRYATVTGHRFEDGRLVLVLAQQSSRRRGPTHKWPRFDTSELEVLVYEDFVGELSRPPHLPKTFSPVWLSVMLPADQFEAFCAKAARHWQSSRLVFIPSRSRRARDVSLCVTNDDGNPLVMGVLVMRTATSPEQAHEFQAINEKIMRIAYDFGGRRYLGDSLPKSRAEWVRHLGAEKLEQLETLKHRLDPHAILGPGHLLPFSP